MPYATQAQLISRYGERTLVALTDRAEIPTHVVAQGVVDRALADTDAIIDGYLMARYVLPITGTVPPLLADLAQAIAIYKLHVQQADPKIEADYKDALRMLQQIAAGTMRLPVAGIEPPTQGGSGAVVTDRVRPFSADTMKGFI